MARDVLCPTVLPRALLGEPGRPPPVLGADRYFSSEPGLDIGYGAPWESDPNGGLSEAKVRPHLWRNNPCCFLHLVIQRQVGGVPARAKPRSLGGLRGRLLPANGKYFEGPYFGNHVRFFFRRQGVAYVATLHTFGNRATTALLGRIVASFRPARSLPMVVQAPTLRVGTGASAAAAAAGSLWLAVEGDPLHGFSRAEYFERSGIVRVDEASGRLTRIPFRGRPADVAIADGSVWVAGYRGNTGYVWRIDPRSNRIRAAIRGGTWPHALAVRRDAVWVVTNSVFFKPGKLLRIDSRTNRIEAPSVLLGPAPAGLGAGRSGLWVADAADGTVRRIDPASRRVVARIRLGGIPFGVAVGLHSVWVTNVDDGTVSRIDPTANRVVATIPVGQNPYGIALGRDAVWVANLGDGTVSRIDPETNLAARPIAVGGDPLAIAADRDGVWVTKNSDGTVVRLEAPRSTHRVGG